MTVGTNTEVTVTVTAYDSVNARITTGGEKLAIDVHNECTLDSKKTCEPIASATKTIAKTINQAMTDNSNGTYTSKFKTENNGGKVTVVAYKVRDAGFRPSTSFYQSANFQGTSIDITQPQFAVEVSMTSGSKSPFSLKQLCYFKTTAGAKTLYLSAHKGCGTFSIDDEVIADNVCDQEVSRSFTFAADREYKLFYSVAYSGTATITAPYGYFAKDKSESTPTYISNE